MGVIIIIAVFWLFGLLMAWSMCVVAARADRRIPRLHNKATGSDALSGTETSTGLRNRLVVLEYVPNPTTMPDTGGHASHLSLAIGGLAMVAAMALSVLAHRRRHNHFNPPV